MLKRKKRWNNKPIDNNGLVIKEMKTTCFVYKPLSCHLRVRAYVSAQSLSCVRLFETSWDFPGQEPEMGCHFLLQWIFPTQALNPHLLPWQTDSFTTASPGKLGVGAELGKRAGKQCVSGSCRSIGDIYLLVQWSVWFWCVFNC